MGEKTILPQIFAEIDLNYYLDLVRDDTAVFESVSFSPVKSSEPDRNLVIVIKSDALGVGVKGLGSNLLFEFLQSAVRSKVRPGAIILLNSGVCLAHKDPFAGKLLSLEELGVKIMVCISSADKYNIMDSINAGFLASMDEIYSVITSAQKVISL